MVVTLNKTVAGLEVEVSKHKANILECKDKMSQISNKVEENTEKMKKVSTDYVKKQDLQQLLQDQGTKITSQGNTDMNSATEQGLSLETILMGQAKYNPTFQMASQPAMIFHGEINSVINAHKKI